ncbi:MAG TPA: flavin reductase family protein [Acidimicrobiales bacterium]|nr:flavin reductase family protein [Acidimicrobiales bacterium]
MAEGRLTGPFPEGRDPEEYDRERRRILWSLPTGLYVLGSAASGRRNLMTLNWATQVATDPKLLAVSVEVGAVTHKLVTDGGAFSLNVLAREDRAMVRKFVKPLEDDGDPRSLGGFGVRTRVTGAPILESALAWLDCRVWQTVPCNSHTLFLGEVVDCGNGNDSPAEVLRMEDTRMSYGG